MKRNLSIAGKIGLGFGILTLGVVINTFLTLKTLNDSIQVNKRISEIYSPSVDYLNELREMISDSKMLIKSWVFIDKKDDTPDKLRLRQLHHTSFPKIHQELSKMSANWTMDYRNKYESIYYAINDSLFRMHNFIMEQLSGFESYNDPMVLFEVQPMVEEDGELIKLTSSILKRLNSFINDQRIIVDQARVEMNASFEKLYKIILYMGIGLVIVALMVSIVTIRSQVRPINFIKRTLFSMAKGIMPENEIKEGTDEIGQMSKALNALVRGLIAISEFATHIGKGDYNTDFTPLSEKDALGNSLITMREELKVAAEEEKKRKEEDEQRNWATHGMAMFGEILRKNNDNLEELSYNVIHNLVLYLEANQGGLFLINDDIESDIHIEQVASYAYDRRKMMQTRIEMGEGLIGRCVLEKETTYIKDLPQDYVYVTSGLGDANPSTLLIIPLISNEKVFGVIEIASFKEFLPFQIEFVEKVGESIAGTIANVKISIQTSLLLEKSKQQAEEMNAQEEEMRQNLEELAATQEEMGKSRTDAEANLLMLRRIIELLPFPIFVKDINSRYIIVNQEHCKLIGLTPEQIMGKADDEILPNPEEIMIIKESDFKVLHENQKITLPTQKISTPHGIEKTVYTVKIPIINELTKNPNILGISVDQSQGLRLTEGQEESIKEIERLTGELAFYTTKEKSLEKKVKELEDTIKKLS
ncbi:MAG: GAF domain-containing protein [Bacteroidales bacterium]|nr:GAF domain-containing protein [Bacteroidales bacterium]